MSQKEMIRQMLELGDVLHEMSIEYNKTTLLSNNDDFRKFRAVVKALNLYVDIADTDNYGELGDE